MTALTWTVSQRVTLREVTCATFVRRYGLSEVQLPVVSSIHITGATG